MNQNSEIFFKCSEELTQQPTHYLYYINIPTLILNRGHKLIGTITLQMLLTLESNQFSIEEDKQGEIIKFILAIQRISKCCFRDLQTLPR